MSHHRRGFFVFGRKSDFPHRVNLQEAFLSGHLPSATHCILVIPEKTKPTLASLEKRFKDSKKQGSHFVYGVLVNHHESDVTERHVQQWWHKAKQFGFTKDNSFGMIIVK